MVKHNAYLYNAEGKRVGKKVLRIGSKIKASGTKEINGKLFCQLKKDCFIKAGNILGSKRTLQKKAYIYKNNGRKTKKIIKKGHEVRTYGSAIKLHHKLFYRISSKELVRKANF